MKGFPGITVVIPTIPPREKMLDRAKASVAGAAAEMARLYPQIEVDLIAVSDFRKIGAARTRHHGLMDVSTEWVAFLDDDDVMHPDHLVQLYGAALEHGADYLWSRFQIVLTDNAWSACEASSAAECPVGIHKYASDQRVHLVERVRTVQGPQFLGEKAFSQWNDDDPCQTTITTLVRTELALAAGGFEQFSDSGALIDGNRRGEDHEFTLRCRKAGGVFRHVPEVTWDWHHHSSNTSGLPTW